MLVSMQGNWTIHVKSLGATFPQRLVVNGADTGNGTYNAVIGMKDIAVTGSQWTIAILNDPGNGFQLSDVRIKAPLLQGGQYLFDIASNDAGNDQDFNDLILTCSTPAMIDDFIIYGNVNLYSGRCIFNPCYRRWLVIDSFAQLRKALEIPGIREVIEKYYPERIPPIKVNPNPPDPPPYFTPMMVNLLDERQIPPQQANVFQRLNVTSTDRKNTRADEPGLLTDFNFRKQISLSPNAAPQAEMASSTIAEKISLSKALEQIRLFCSTKPGKYLTLNFEEYDRTTSELAGGAYTGTGNRTSLGTAITDVNGNYLFRFKQTLSELINEVLSDVGSGETIFTQVLPDIIVKVKDTIHPSETLFESAPYFNVPHLKRINLCLPAAIIPSTSSLCFNGNMVGSLGNVFIGGNANVNAGESAAALDRDGYNNHLHADGVISVHNTLAGFDVDCACWTGTVDVKGCLFNLQRKKTDPIIRYYTIRFKKPGDSWQYVNETYRHPRFSKRNMHNYSGDLVGPFLTDLHVDGGPLQGVSAYKNIQAETYFDGEDWEFTNLDRYMQLHTSLYENNSPGTIYFRIDGYDEQKNPVPNATDLVALFVNNRALDFGLGTVAFTDPIEYIACGLYKMSDAQMNTPLQIPFKANDAWGFVDNYRLTIGKCPNVISLDVTSPPALTGTVSNGILANGEKADNTDSMSPSCPGYGGTLEDFATAGYVGLVVKPSASAGGWMQAAEQYVVISGSLTARKRQTNGYNGGYSNTHYDYFSFAIERKP